MYTANSLNEAIKNIYGTSVKITDRRAIHGGDINDAYALSLSNGETVFMKANIRQKLAIFEGEAESLAFIRQIDTLRSPETLAIGTDGSISFLLLEYINSGHHSRSASEELGIGLAHMHQQKTDTFVKGGKYGALHDHLLGSGIQDNTPMDSWIMFFSECRLRPWFNRTSHYFDSTTRNKIDSFLNKLSTYLTEPDYPSLLHGDLWGGNYIIDNQAHPWLIDPASYVGHAESEIAFTELFGGFDRTFYEAYQSIIPFNSGYRDRRDIYNLYHLLKHLHLFGSIYLSSVKAVLNKYA